MNNAYAHIADLGSFAVALPVNGSNVFKVLYEPDIERWVVSAKCFYFEPEDGRISTFYFYHSDHDNKEDAEHAANRLQNTLSAIFPNEQVFRREVLK